MSKNPPDDLQDAGKALWVSIACKYELRPDEAAVLHDACRMRDLEAAVLSAWGDAGRPMLTVGSQGEAIHPLIREFRDLAGRIAGLLAKLKLPDLDDVPAVNQNRDAAQSSWKPGVRSRGA